MAGHTMGNSQNFRQSWDTEPEVAQKSTESASEALPSFTVTVPAAEPSEESIREQITLEFEKRLEGERRRRKEVLERAQDLHHSRETELLEKLDARDKRVCELEEEVAVWKEDVERVEETLQKFIRISEEDQAEAVQNAEARRKAEADCAALREIIAEKDEALRNLGAELEEAKRSIGLSSPSASDSNGSGQQQPAEPPSADVPTTDTGADVAYVQKLEEEIKAHVEDIRLYKLDVRGYRKDVRSRDAKISYMTQHIADLEKTINAKTTETEDLRQRLAMAEKKPEMDSQQRQPEASQQRLKSSTGLGLNFDEVADLRRVQTTPDWPLPQSRQRNHNSSTPIRHTRNLISGRSGNLNFSNHCNSENEHGFQSQVSPLAPHHTPHAQQQGQEVLPADSAPTLPSKESRNKPLPIPGVTGAETVVAHLRPQRGVEQATQGVGVPVVGGVPGESWILD
jgi:hypothetical protein